MTAVARLKKHDKEDMIKAALCALNYECCYLGWASDLDYLWNGGGDEGDFNDPEYAESLNQLGTLDYVVANAFIRVRELVLLLAEMHGVIPAFSKDMADDTPLFDMFSTDVEFSRTIEDAAFCAAASAYGFTFPDYLNFSTDDKDIGVINDSAICLHPKVQEKAYSYGYSSRSLVWDDIVKGAAPELIEKALLSSRGFDKILSLVSEDIISQNVRYTKLPKKFQKGLKEEMDCLMRLHSSINDFKGEAYVCQDSDSITLDSGFIAEFNYINGWDTCGGDFVLPAATQCYGPLSIFDMKEAHRASKGLEKALRKLEKKAEATKKKKKVKRHADKKR